MVDKQHLRSLSALGLFTFTIVSNLFALEPKQTRCAELAALGSADPSSDKLVQANEAIGLSNKTAQSDPIQAYFQWFSNRSVFPSDGVFHVVGPGINHYEWSIALLARADLQIVVSEKNDFLEILTEDWEPYLEMTWEDIASRAPGLIARSEHINSLDAFKAEFLKRAVIINGVESTVVSKNGKVLAVPKADVILIRNPQYPIPFGTQVKPGTLVWTSSFDGRAETQDVWILRVTSKPGLQVEGPIGSFALPFLRRERLNVNVSSSPLRTEFFGTPKVGHLWLIP